MIGVEIAGALKNILAIGAGVIGGSGYGINTTSAFISRGTKEIYKFAKHYKANPQTLFGLSGVGKMTKYHLKYLTCVALVTGDIMLTGFGTLSRNRTFGERLGKGESIHKILETSKGVVEGVSTLQVVVKYAEENKLDMPITM